MQRFELYADLAVNSTEFYAKDGHLKLTIDDDNILCITEFERIEKDEYGFKLPEGLEGSRVHECTLATLQFTREQALQLKEWINENIH